MTEPQPSIDEQIGKRLRRLRQRLGDRQDEGQRAHQHQPAGHAEADLLVLQNDAGEPLLAGAAGLAAFLATHLRLQLFFVNGCCTQAQIDGLHAAALQRQAVWVQPQRPHQEGQGQPGRELRIRDNKRL